MLRVLIVNFYYFMFFPIFRSFLRELKISDKFIVEDIPRSLERSDYECSKFRGRRTNGVDNKQLMMADIFKEKPQQTV